MKLQKSTGLDIRVFDDALTFKIAMMVVSYMKYMETQDYRTKRRIMMIQLLEGGTYLVNGNRTGRTGKSSSTGTSCAGRSSKTTMAYNILKDHNTSGNMEKLQIKFDKLTSMISLLWNYSDSKASD